MICALESFFAHLTAVGIVSIDPARFLSRLTRRTLAERALVTALREAGLSVKEARSLSWRDIVAVTIGGNAALTALPLNDSLRRRLTAELLERLRSATVDRLNNVLDAPLSTYGF